MKEIVGGRGAKVLYNVIQYAKLPYMNLILLEGEKLNLRLQI